MWAALVVVSARPTPAPDASPGADAAIRGGYERIAEELLCHCGCARQTIRGCTCGVAFGLREQFEARLKAGEPADSIIAAYIAEHGEQARNAPPKKGLNLLAWFGPGIAIILAGAATIVVLLIWVARGRKAGPPVEAPAPSAEDQAARQRIERELREFEP